MCIRDIYHHVSGDTLPHMAINHAFGKNSYAGCGTINRPLCRWEAHIWRETLRIDVTSELLNMGK